MKVEHPEKGNRERNDREIFDPAQTKIFGEFKALPTKLGHHSRNLMFSEL